MRNAKTWNWLAALLLIGIVLRLGVLASFTPLSFPDTSTYVQAARDLLSGDYSIGLGRRTPGYPLLIALVGESPMALTVAQMAAGLALSAALFGIAMLLTGRPGLAFAAGLSYDLNLQQLYQEAILTTESLCALGVAATLLVFLWMTRRLRAGRPAVGAAVVLGVLAAFSILVRPQFIFFPVVLPVLLIWAVSRWHWPDRRALGAAAVTAATSGVLILGWCAVLQAKVGVFTLSTQSGFGMVNHPIDYIELAPERYAVVRDVLVKTREERIRAVGHSRNTIWYAWPEIQRVTGWTLPQASRELQHMCTEMFIAYPGRYAISVAHAWVDFWTVPIMWQADESAADGPGAALKAIWWVEHNLLRLANLAFVLTVLAAAVSGRARRRLQWDVGMTAIAATVLLSSLVQSLFDQGASSRYAIPTQALVVVMLMVAGLRLRAAAPVGIGSARPQASAA